MKGALQKPDCHPNRPHATLGTLVLLRLFQLALRGLDRLRRRLPWQRQSGPAHLATGRRGEEDAYFHLRRQGYVIVARNYRSRRRRGEIDLIGWDGDMLCFIEVKTRTTRDVKPAEAAVDDAKQRELAGMAREYCRHSGAARATPPTPVRFDIVSVYHAGSGLDPEITLFKNAFRMT
jgi:putative endonuclease